MVLIFVTIRMIMRFDVMGEFMNSEAEFLLKVE